VEKADGRDGQTSLKIDKQFEYSTALEAKKQGLKRIYLGRLRWRRCVHGQ